MLWNLQSPSSSRSPAAAASAPSHGPTVSRATRRTGWESWSLPGLALFPCFATRRGQKRTARKAQKLPDLLQSTLGKRELKKTIIWYMEKYGPEKTKEMLDRMKTMGFSWATRAGISLGVDDMSVPEGKAPLCDGSNQRQLNAEAKFQNGEITVVEKFLSVTEEWTRTSEKVKDEAVKDFKENNPKNPVYMMSTSGARGNISQVRQLVAMRGLMADATGQLIDVPIQHCLREGMTVTDMLISGHGARKGVIDTALRTANSGYLYRRLDFTASPVVVRSKDCGTLEGWPQSLRKRKPAEANFSERIRGRVLAAEVKSRKIHFPRGHLLSTADAQAIEGEWKELAKDGEVPDVLVRTPLTCQDRHGICAKCYGEDLSTGKLVEVGHPSGTIAAQSMGEPGTQLTMRTFHTGGAFEGSAGEGVLAEFPGEVSLMYGAETISKSDISKTHAAVAQWKRSPQGDVGCVLAEECTLEVKHEKNVQTEKLEKGCYVKVLHGSNVTFGQVLYEKPKEVVSRGDDDSEVLDKQIRSAGGEVLVNSADPKSNCIEEGGKLVWVLQGSEVLDLVQDKGCSLAVQTSDLLGANQAIIQEWAKTAQPGVPRFQEPPRTVANKEALCLRTDFDSFYLRAKRATEYVSKCKVPRALEEEYHGRLPGTKKNWHQAFARAFEKAAEIRSEKVKAPSHVKVLTQVDDESVRIMCNSPSLERGFFLNAACRECNKERVMPTSGLVLYLNEGTVLWSPEETIKLHSQKLEDIKQKHQKSIPSPGRELLFQRRNGTCKLVTEADGTVVRRSQQRVYYSKDVESLDDPDGHWECSIKTGRIFFAPSHYFKEGDWWQAAQDADAQDTAEDEGVYFFQRAIPPNVPICAELTSTKKHKDWILAEILDDPRSGKYVRVLLRQTRCIDLPEFSTPMPAESRTVRLWSVPHENGELVESMPLVLAHDVVASVGRHCRDLHCTTAVPSGDPASDVQPSLCGVGNTPLEESSVWMPGDLCVVQHTPLGPARSAAATAQWRAAEPGYEPCLEAEQFIPRRALRSQTSGIVCRALEDRVSGRLSTMVLNGDDVFEVQCHARPSCRVGELLRRNDPLSAKDCAPQQGQVLAIQEREPGEFVVLLRKASTYLVTSKGNVQVKSGSLVQMGDVVATEPQVVPRTSDIVQGLPRIDRLFEAAGGEHQARIDEIFEEEKKHRNVLNAAIHARFRFEEELVSEIQSAYGEQGVSIQSKHIEVVVRRMTETCQLLVGVGGLAPGTTLEYAELEALSALQPSGEVKVRPLVNGLTSVGRDNSHVLMAMGFREVDTVLTNAILKGSGRHELDGVKENLMIGKAVSVGSKTSKKEKQNIKFQKIPQWG